MKYFLDNPAGFFRPPKDGDAGFDLYSSVSLEIYPGEVRKIQTGLYLEIDPGVVGIIKDRSSMALAGLRIGGGVIDPSYRGEIQVILSHHGTRPYEIKAGDRIAQILFIPYVADFIQFFEVEDPKDLTLTQRGSKGFGSTGK